MINLKTKNDFKEALLKLVNPLKSRYSDGCAKLNIGETAAMYSRRTSTMEAFSRPLWGLSPLWAGGNHDKELEEIYLKGIISGTDKMSPEYWGDVTDNDQKMVEMAALGYALITAPEKVWNPLNDSQKANFSSWMRQINEHSCYPNNWKMFAVLVNVGLKNVGEEYSRDVIEHGLSFLESFYIGGGWYKDGHLGNKDYYISFAIHFYSLIYAKAMENEDKERCELFKTRAKEFALDFVYWFDENGAGIPYGRSLTYRFAQTAFWSACVYAGVEVFPIGVIKGLITRNLNDWLKSPIFDNAEILTIGYKYPNLNMAERYNAPGSPYWALKSFAVLALSDNHEFWSADALELPQLAHLKTLKYADMVVSRDTNNVIAFPSGFACLPGHVHMSEKYSKFAYSTKFGFSVPRSLRNLDEAATDSMLAFEIFGNIFVRTNIEDFKIVDDKITSTWIPLEGITVKTTIVPCENGHKRFHDILSEYDCSAYDCGFAVADDERFNFKCDAVEGFAVACNDFSLCKVKSENGEGCVINAVPNTNLIYPKTQIPSIKYEIKKGINKIVTTVEQK
ncbi:MAG: DUF2264 domain-containing protein [Oscillospiraceae bacterium]